MAITNLCFVYDRVNKLGGAERVIQNLHALWPTAPLYTAVYNKTAAPWANNLHVIPSFINQIPGANRHHEWLPNLMPYAFESLNVSQYDVVLSITSAEAKGVITTPHQLHICYLLTPTRYLWSHSAEYAGSGLLGWLRRCGMAALRRWDQMAASRPDKIIAISAAVAARCEQYYHRQVDAVIYPPVETDYFSTHPDTCTHPEPGYFLTVSRLVPYKRVDLAIQACNRTKDRLIVVGTGSETNYLKQIAGPTITFVGQISDETLACLYHHARGFLFPQEEEFGISAVEAQSAGLPVVAFNRGSAKEIIVANKTGILFESQTVASLVQAINTLKTHTWYDKTIQEHARQFSSAVFQQRIQQFVEETWQTQSTRE